MGRLKLAFSATEAIFGGEIVLHVQVLYFPSIKISEGTDFADAQSDLHIQHI